MAKQLLCVDCALHYEVLMVKTRCGPDLEVDRCTRCGGVWLDSGEFESLVELGHFYISHLDALPETEPEKNQTRKCPKCNIPLKIIKHEKHPDIELDVCPRCGGLWCDSGELKEIAKKYPAVSGAALARDFSYAKEHIMDKVFYIHQLKNSAIVFEDLLSSLPRERLDHVFGGTVWTIHEHVQHLAMTQIMLQKRIQQFITQEEPRIIPFTPSGHAEKSNLKPINELVGIFKKWRTQQIDAINEAGEKICKKLALHPEYVEYSFPILIRHIILHDYFHYYRIEELGLLKTENITSI